MAKVFVTKSSSTRRVSSKVEKASLVTVTRPRATDVICLYLFWETLGGMCPLFWEMFGGPIYPSDGAQAWASEGIAYDSIGKPGRPGT